MCGERPSFCSRLFEPALLHHLNRMRHPYTHLDTPTHPQQHAHTHIHTLYSYTSCFPFLKIFALSFIHLLFASVTLVPSSDRCHDLVEDLQLQAKHLREVLAVTASTRGSKASVRRGGGCIGIAQRSEMCLYNSQIRDKRNKCSQSHVSLHQTEVHCS